MTAVCLLVVMALMAAALVWTTVSLAIRAMASSTVAGFPGTLVVPAPKIAAGLPKRPGPASEPGAIPIVAVLRQRFGAVGGALLRDARLAGQHAASGARGRAVTARWTSGLYGQPGHIDPLTGQSAWVMYIGLSSSRTLGPEADTISRLMRGILGPNPAAGPWQVAAGRRGGTANCTVASLAPTQVAVCGWATGHAIGVVASPLRDTSVAELATMMAMMRLDLQQR